jgi:hypothetical protein
MLQSALLQRGVQVVKEYMQIQHVFPFWKAIEALTPQKIDKDNPDDKLTPAYKLLKNVRNEFIVFRDGIFSGDGTC